MSHTPTPDNGSENTCVAPGCGAVAALTFIAAQDGRLGGQDWQEGDPIFVCMPHGTDIYKTQGAHDPSMVAEWLRPDAADPPNTWHPARFQVGPLENPPTGDPA